MQEQQPLNDQLVSDFLRQHSAFFERNAHLLTEIFLPSPHGNGAISLTERQQLALRDKIRANEAFISELIEHAKENDKINQKVHALSVDLISHRQLDQIAQIVSKSMHDAFQVDSADLHCWIPIQNAALTQHAIFAPFPEVFSQWVARLEKPYCGEKPASLEIYLEEALQSFAFIPLSKHVVQNQPTDDIEHLPCIGVLILASKDATHFKSDMGTIFLNRIGDIVSAALVNAHA